MSATTPVFSIVVPTYRRPAQLDHCLRSIAQLDYPRDQFEVIVIDDGSPDPPADVVQQYQSTLDISLITQVHLGVGAARNAAAQKAKGKHLIFTADDCAPSVGWLRAMEDAVGREPDDTAIGGSIHNGCSGNIFAATSQMLTDYLCFEGAMKASGPRFFTPNNLAVPTDGFRVVGGFDPTYVLSAGEDRDFCARWMERGFRLAYCPAAEVVHRHPLTLFSFVRMHWRYGRGSSQFRLRRAGRSGRRVHVEPFQYYLSLVAYPIRRNGPWAILPVLLLSISQVASGVGKVSYAKGPTSRTVSYFLCWEM